MRKLKNEELNRITIEEFKKSEKIPLIIVLDNVRSLNNIGSIFRTADAFRVEAIYLCGITAQPPHREIEKTALGATASVHWEYFKNTVDAIGKLKNERYIVLAIEQVDKSIMLNEFIVESNKKYAVIFGHEINGVGEDAIKIAYRCIEIPQTGTKHSLNIAVSAGIVLWDFFMKLQK